MHLQRGRVALTLTICLAFAPILFAWGDTNTNVQYQVVATIPVGHSSGAVAVTPDGSHVYVSSSLSTVSVIDTRSNTVVETVNVGMGAASLAISPNGQFVYVANPFSNTISVISTASNSVVSTIPNVDFNPSFLVVSPDGQTLYAITRSNASDSSYFDTMSVIDIASRSVVATVNIGKGAGQLVINPSGQYVYITNSRDQTVTVISTLTNSIVATIKVRLPFAGFAAISPDGQFVYVAGVELYVIDTTSNSVVTTIPLDDFSMNIAVSPDGRFVYIGNLAVTDNSITVVSTVTKSIITTIDLGPKSKIVDGVAVAVNPNGQFIYASLPYKGVVKVIEVVNN